MKRCIACKKKISEEEGMRVRNRYPIMDDEEYDEFEASLRFYRKHIREEEWETYYLDDGVEVLCEKCWNEIMQCVL